LSKKNITPMADRRIAADERACARFGGIMSSQPSNFRRTDIKRAVQAMQAARLKVGHVEPRRGTVRILPVNGEDDGGDDDSNNSFDKIMRKPAKVQALSEDNT
jgi:hypothetical protein